MIQLRKSVPWPYITKVFHYGSANISSDPRALLHFSFQAGNRNCDIKEEEEIRQEVDEKEFDDVYGFTYHLHNTVANKFRLDSFPCIHWLDGFTVLLIVLYFIVPTVLYSDYSHFFFIFMCLIIAGYANKPHETFIIAKCCRCHENLKLRFEHALRLWKLQVYSI